MISINQNKRFSQFFEKKSEPREIKFIVLHHVQANSADEAIRLFKENQVSSHFLIDEEGEIFGLVDEKDIAWHAGVSFWRGVDGLNKNSVGIEFINSAPFEKKFSKQQLESGLKLCHQLIDKYKI